MSTRAIYTFKDEYSTVHVYKHHDGYPEGGLSWIANALHFAWPLPRFEADDFAAAFVAANKTDRRTYEYGSGGGVRLIANGEPWEFAADAAYHYIITHNTKGLKVEIHSVNWWEGYTRPEILFKGSLADAIEKFGANFLEDDPLNWKKPEKAA